MKAPMTRNMRDSLPAMGDQERLAQFAHDMRTPMCAVSGAAQMALSAREGADVREQMEQILAAVRTMDRMLERLAGEQTKESTFTGEMLRRELLAMAGGQAAGKGVRLNVDLYAMADRWLWADYGALSRVLTNLVNNAVKYTPPGGMVCVRASLEAARPWGGLPRLTVIVSDDGIGMKPSFMRRMYAPFARAKESAHLPGKGLGLAIARKLVRQMGGTIGARSEWGKGTAFTVRIPVRLCPADREDTEKPAGLTGGMKAL